MNPAPISIGSASSTHTKSRTSLDILRSAPNAANTSPVSSSFSSTTVVSAASPSTSLALTTVNPLPSPPTSTKIYPPNPSILVHKEHSNISSDNNERNQRNTSGSGQPAKIALKRSRSPIKLIKNIRSYMHIHKHSKHNPHLLTNASNSLVPPGGDVSSHNYRTTALPSSSILSPGSTSSCQPGGQRTARVPRERHPSDTLDPEKQVLLLRVMSYFEHAGHRADEETAEYLLSSYQWDIQFTLQYCQDLVEAVHGTLLPIQQETHLSGAVNDQMTSCYIDALLFAMFARLSAFEGLLNVNLDGESESDSDNGSAQRDPAIGSQPKRAIERQEMLLSTHRLQTWLRMFVNQLRSGKLIQAHVVKELRQHLYSCGWNCPGPKDPPGSSRQEDASELFMFLTEKLHLPYLPLEQRLLHGAKISDDDDKVITERMLQISIPTPTHMSPSLQSQPLLGGPAKQPKESTFSKLLGQKSSPSSSSSTSSASHSRNGSLIGNKDIEDSTSGGLHDILSLERLLAHHFYDNTLTGIRRKVSSGTGVPLSPGVEVPVSAWQVLELLPFYSSSNEQGGEIFASQSQYPADVVILPLILKRYSIGPNMLPQRNNTPIDIPRRIDFSRFVNPQTPGIGKKDTTTTAPLETRGPGQVQVPAPTETELFSKDVNLEPDTDTTVQSQSSQNTAELASTLPSPLPKINTQVKPPARKYSTSLLQAATTGAGVPESPMMTPGTPPPMYTPSHAKQFVEFTDDNKSWSHPAVRTGRDYLDCHPKVKYMLELKSVVCHLGTQLNAGHYRSYVADVAATATVSHATSPSTSTSTPTTAAAAAAQEPNWLRHDDLDPSGSRVQLIERDSVNNMDMESDWARNGTPIPDMTEPPPQDPPPRGHLQQQLQEQQHQAIDTTRREESLILDHSHSDNFAQNPFADSLADSPHLHRVGDRRGHHTRSDSITSSHSSNDGIEWETTTATTTTVAASSTKTQRQQHHGRYEDSFEFDRNQLYDNDDSDYSTGSEDETSDGNDESGQDEEEDDDDGEEEDYGDDTQRLLISSRNTRMGGMGMGMRAGETGTGTMIGLDLEQSRYATNNHNLSKQKQYLGDDCDADGQYDALPLTTVDQAEGRKHRRHSDRQRKGSKRKRNNRRGGMDGIVDQSSIVGQGGEGRNSMTKAEVDILAKKQLRRQMLWNIFYVFAW
ncbi:hypothetical protein BG004_007556 [Podila humilis]|nr:hypothetical protein BG004_007556 [Podila humilis]